MKNICIFIGSRANYSSIKSAMSAIKEHNELNLQLIVSGSAILSRYGDVSALIVNDGFVIDEKLFMLVEGETLSTMAKSTGIGLIELSTCFERLRPDIVVTVGDRFETMATTLAAAYMNIPIAHTMGGEVTGTIDESIRHAVTKFAHIHFPATTDARDRILKLGEKPDFVFTVGCPRIDLVSDYLNKPLDIKILNAFLESHGVGESIDVSQPFLLVSQHPVTTEFGEARDQIDLTLRSVKSFNMQSIVLWPNADAGSQHIAGVIRQFRESNELSKTKFFKNLPIEIYVNLMKLTSCLIGNSSSAIREGAFIGTPAVNIGTRQHNRQRAGNVINTTFNYDAIITSISKQIKHGKYQSDYLYGDGSAGQQIAKILSELEDIPIQKTISY